MAQEGTQNSRSSVACFNFSASIRAFTARDKLSEVSGSAKRSIAPDCQLKRNRRHLKGDWRSSRDTDLLVPYVRNNGPRKRRTSYTFSARPKAESLGPDSIVGHACTAPERHWLLALLYVRLGRSLIDVVLWMHLRGHRDEIRRVVKCWSA